MGMTIDEAIDFLEESKYSYESSSSDTLDIAIATMRKYQKIEQIMNQEQAKWWGVVKDTWLYKEIREVIEDANNKQAN